VVVAAEGGWQRGGEGAPKKSPVDRTGCQAPGMMPSMWLGWQGSSADHTFSSSPQVCQGRNLPSVSKCALKMRKKSPPVSNQRSAWAPVLLLAGEKEGRKRESG